MTSEEMQGALSEATFSSRFTSYQLMALMRFLANKGVINEDEVLAFMADYLTDFADEFADMMVERGFVLPSRRGEFLQDFTAMLKEFGGVSK